MFVILFSFFAKRFLKKKLSAGLKKNCSGDNDNANDEHSEKANGRDCAVHLVFATILFITAFIILTYILIFIHLPSRKFMNRKDEKCTIQKASLSCWRRKLFSSTTIEVGRHTCWVFEVTHGNTTTKTQYMDVDDFPIKRDKCNSVEQCGEQEWECRVADNPAVVMLNWHYPVRSVLYCIVGLMCTVMLGTSALLGFFRKRRELSKLFSKQADEESQIDTEFLRRNIPFFSEESDRPEEQAYGIRRPPTIYSKQLSWSKTSRL